MGIPSHLPYPCFPSSRSAQLERAVTAFIQADFQLPVMLRLEFSANSLLRSEVHSQPQSWFVKSWQFGCLEQPLPALTFCGWENRTYLLFTRVQHSNWTHIAVVTVTSSSQQLPRPPWGLIGCASLFMSQIRCIIYITCMVGWWVCTQ